MKINDPADRFISFAEQTAASLRALYGRFGYEPYKMSKFEEYDLYARNKEFLISDSIITFTDTDGRLMALKPDVTLSIIKNADVSARRSTKLFYSENVYRVSGGSGRSDTHSGGGMFREIMQTGLECIGKIDTYCLAEVLYLAAKSLDTISGEYVLDIGQLDLLFKAVDNVSVDPMVQAELLKCAEGKNVHEIMRIAKETGADEAAARLLASLVELYGRPCDTLGTVRSAAEKLGMTEEYARFEKVLKALDGTGVSDNIRIDFSIVSDRNYYNGIAFKGYVNGVPERVLSGGQYDRLMDKLSKKGGAIGFAVYMDTLERLGGAGNAKAEAETVRYGADDEPGDVLAAMIKRVSGGSGRYRAEAADND
ncbi:MAG: ATP phosphoribosyltransferase regulatory subunit [Clostridia bacterium]|nr:ATP phosphoribosyltransferase regulatory subunit [Clostridia bacterium]